MSQVNGMHQGAQVNGSKPQSHTLNHVISYPLVNDTITMYQNNPLGAKSISLFNSFYAKFAQPALPYFETPYSMIHPYVQKADQLGDSTLSTVDDHFPALKTTDMEGLKTHAFNVAHYPFKLAGESRDYVVNTYDDEYRKIGGEAGVVTTGKAVISTELRIASDAIHAVADFIGPRKEAAEEQLKQAKQAAQQKLQHAKKTAHEKQQHVANHN